MQAANSRGRDDIEVSLLLSVSSKEARSEERGADDTVRRAQAGSYGLVTEVTAINIHCGLYELLLGG